MRRNCRLILARHGQTQWNLEKRYQGSIDVPLTELGRQQARDLGKALNAIPLKAIYTSPLSRAVETAEIIGHPRGLPLIHDENLKEGSFGSNEGRTIPEVWEEFAPKLHYLSQYHGSARLDHKLVHDQEADRDVITRMTRSLESIGARHPGNVLVISHGGAIRLLLHHLTGIDFLNLHIENAKPYHFTYGSHGLRFVGC
ncbi:MAG: putative phosphoserine phosphatase 2 [Chlamydiae bacterium]|nr:putative phosphoserine phosphatase 2 [Chlamydiota bacterium]